MLLPPSRKFQKIRMKRGSKKTGFPLPAVRKSCQLIIVRRLVKIFHHGVNPAVKG